MPGEREMFCPQAIEWGTASDWANVGVGMLAAGVTFWAVIVALQSSARAENLARELRDSERQVEIERETAQRGILALALDRELYMIFGQTHFAWDAINKALATGVPDHIRLALTNIPTKGFDLMERFASEFSLFPPAAGSSLLHTLGLLIGARNSPPPKLLDEGTVSAGNAVAATLAQLMRHAREARLAMREHFPAGIPRSEIEPLPKGLPD